MPHGIKFTGFPVSEIKKDGNIISFDMEETGSPNAPKGLYKASKVRATIYMNKKQFNKLEIDENEIMNTKLFIQGEIVTDIPVSKCSGEFGVTVFQAKVLDSTPKAKKKEPQEQTQFQELRRESKPKESKSKTEKKNNTDKRNRSYQAINNFYRNSDEISIPTKYIELVEKVHINSNFKLEMDAKIFRKLHKDKKLKSPLVVRKLENNKYGLVMGFQKYVLAKVLNFENVEAIVTEKTHEELMKSLNAEYLLKGYNIPDEKEKVLSISLVNISEIVIPNDYLEVNPNPEKVQEKIKCFLQNGKFDKPIKINKETGELQDGYTRYLAAKELRILEVECIS